MQHFRGILVEVVHPNGVGTAHTWGTLLRAGHPITGYPSWIGVFHLKWNVPLEACTSERGAHAKKSPSTSLLLNTATAYCQSLVLYIVGIIPSSHYLLAASSRQSYVPYRVLDSCQLPGRDIPPAICHLKRIE